MAKIIKNDPWIPIANDLILKEMRIIGTKGFFILCHLLIHAQQNYDYYITDLEEIRQMSRVKDIRTVKKYVKLLIEYKYITISKDIDSINKHVKINIKILYRNKILKNGYYFQVPIELFVKNFKQIKDIGWALLCNLIFYYNMEYGYAFPSYNTLQGNLLVSSKTVSKYINILIKNKLIYLRKQEKSYFMLDENDNEVWKWSHNKYVVKYLDKIKNF